MADVFSRKKRSEIMRAVRCTDTRPEQTVRKLVRGLDRRFRCNVASLPGKPDIVLPHRKQAVFVHGCWWHGHRCKRGRRAPKSHLTYWSAKIQRNRERDRAARRKLAHLGWRVLVVWECQIRTPAELADRLAAFLRR